MDETMKADARAASFWRGLEHWLELLWGADALSHLPPPASGESIARFEERIGARMPAEMRAVYAVHDGGAGLLTLTEVLERWELIGSIERPEGDEDEEEIRTSGPVRPSWWESKWLPITEDGSGNAHCIDLRPARGGRVGQVIAFYHDGPERLVLASSLFEYLIRESWLEWALNTFGEPRS
jgi:cell wall assembly regulator SMI1